MRFNRWLRKESLHDIDRMCVNHPESATLIRMLAVWMIEQLAEDAHKKGEVVLSPDEKVGYAKWTAGPITVIYTLLPEPDRTVIIDGFLPSR